MTAQLNSYYLLKEEEHLLLQNIGALFWVAFLIWALGQVLVASVCVLVRLGKADYSGSR